MEKCSCFSCTYKDNPHILYGYNKGHVQNLKTTIHELEKFGIKKGELSSETKNLENLLAVLYCELEMFQESLTYSEQTLQALGVETYEQRTKSVQLPYDVEVTPDTEWHTYHPDRCN